MTSMSGRPQQQHQKESRSQKILKAMIEKRVFGMRSMSGIAMDAGLSVVQVKQSLNRMIERKLISEAKTKDGQPALHNQHPGADRL